MINEIRQSISRNLLSIPGWHTNRKIVIIESDDWGSIRMPSKDIYERLFKYGIRVDKNPFTRFDSLASEEDLSALFDILMKFRDKNGNHPVITANSIMSNPDFDKIRESNFYEYHYEVFTETLKRYPKHQGSFQIWKEGMSAGVFHPQFHGREHVNVAKWLNALKNDTGNIRKAFEYRMYDLSREGEIITEDSFMDAYAYNNKKELDFLKTSIIEGTQVFEDLFGYRSQSFIAPCYIWDPELEKTMKECGIKFIQGGLVQKCPVPGNTRKHKRKFHFTGSHNKYDQKYLVRNCYFEPTASGSDGLIQESLQRISTAFKWNKPAIISSHRLNYIGYIVPENRKVNIDLLAKLLHRIIKDFPDVEFMTSDQLGELMVADT
jgi:hypothetical protein